MSKEDNVLKVLACIGAQTWEALAQGNGMICGGALTSAFSDAEINDVDVYFRSQEDLRTAFALAAESFGSTFLGHTEKAYTLRDQETGKQLQFICFRYFENPQAVFESFDFSINQAALDFAGVESVDSEQDPELVESEDFLLSVAARKLKFNPVTPYPWVSLLRAEKYKQRGYKISYGDQLAIAFACQQRPIESWEDAKEQLGGVYGQHIEIHSDQPFSEEAFYDILLGDNFWFDANKNPEQDWKAACVSLGIESNLSTYYLENPFGF